MLSTSFFEQFCNCNVQTVLRIWLLFCLVPYASLCSASTVWLLLLMVICLSMTLSFPGRVPHPQWSITSPVVYNIPVHLLFAAKSLSASIPRTLSIAYTSSAIHVDNPKPNPMMNFETCLGVHSSNRCLVTSWMPPSMTHSLCLVHEACQLMSHHHRGASPPKARLCACPLYMYLPEPDEWFSVLEGILPVFDFTSGRALHDAAARTGKTGSSLKLDKYKDR